MKIISTPKTTPRPSEKISPSRRRRLEKVLKQFLAGEVSLMSLAAIDDVLAQNPYRRVHE